VLEQNIIPRQLQECDVHNLTHFPVFSFVIEITVQSSSRNIHVFSVIQLIHIANKYIHHDWHVNKLHMSGHINYK
jgi:hypothetical protein